MIRGITIKLYEKTEVGRDSFNRPIFVETPVEVDNVLVGSPAADEVVNEMQLSGKRIQFTLAIPKGDLHCWKDVTVEFFGRKFKTFGDVLEGIEEMMPLAWHKKVKVEAYE